MPLMALSDNLAERIQRGDHRAVARAITAIENGEEGGAPLLKQLFLSSRKGRIIGVTGPPGVGKSTLVEKLAALARQRGLRVGILAVDPSSPFSGGAILGDRIRMQSLFADEGVYIRSMATRGRLGGLAAGAWDAVTVLEAAGCEVIMIETVGVGQDEVDVASLADMTVLLLAPGMGDEVQAFKAGVMEIADVFVINKADCGDPARAERALTAVLGAAPPGEGWQRKVAKTVATTGEGVEGLWQIIGEFFEGREGKSFHQQRERERWRKRIQQITQARLLRRMSESDQIEGLLRGRIEAILRREIDPYSVVEELMQGFSSNTGQSNR